MSTITLTKDVDSDTLYLPELQRFVGRRVEIVVRNSESTPRRDPALAAAVKSLREMWLQSCQPNWDGEGAEAVAEATHESARRLLESLPEDVRLPDMTAEPDGQLNFEWYQSPRRLLSVSVSESGTLYWAALIGAEDPRGSCQFTDRFPPTLLYWIEQVFA